MPRPPHPFQPGLPRWAVWAGIAGLLAVTSGCSGPERVNVDGFAPGACRDAAPTVQDIDEALIAADEEDVTPKEAGVQLKTAQDQLLQVRDSADAPLAQAITDLVTALGFFRISVDSNSYDGTQVADARVPFDALVQRCTA
ncbi:MAG: hypothetical protein ACR2K2_06115 [Mycobacteriales bacterium]